MATITDQHAKARRTTGKRWLARVWDPVTRKHVTKAFTEYIAAKHWATDIELKALQRRTPGAHGDLQSWSEQFLLDGVSLSASYRQQVALVVKSAVAAGLNDPGVDVASPRIRVWLQDLRRGRRSESTVLGYFSVYRHLVRWATQSGLYCGLDPTLRVQRPRNRAAEGHLREVFTVEELKMLVREGMRSDPLFMPVCVLVYGGLRMGEVRAMCWSWDRGLVLRVQGDDEFMPKSYHERQLPIQHELRALIDTVPRGKLEDRMFPVLWKRDPSDASADIQRYIERAGVDRRGRTAHCLRHTWVSLSQAIGVPTGNVQRRAGHNQASTTAIYSRMIDAFLDAAQSWPQTSVGHFYLRRNPSLIPIPPKSPVLLNPDETLKFSAAEEHAVPDF